ncbi:MAG: hypothetical protein EHM61_02530 [Acidobacteria bacterium]|nr:MAG: hypothetical protein EHM61_02530 [Acidobacteriota bacterium]
MDLISFFRPSPEKQIEKLRKKVKEPHGDPATRINAERKLLEMGSEPAILALLDRFTISASPSRQDEEEKEELLNWIVELRETAVPPIVRFLKRERQVYWPFRALQSILPADQIAKTGEELLLYHWENPPASPDPTAQMIRLMEGHHTPSLQQTIRNYLLHEDDDVRLAALDYFLKRPEEEARESVLESYLDSEDRPRIRAHILDRLVDLGWSVRGFRPKIEETLPEGYVITRDGAIKAILRRP